ncbi:MAG: ATP-dependent DNA helicase RecG [Cycloclasticus sp. symbiont of Bathymodiolus heckerae]|nr:MAG: ATP-dependent DNA helicase RecG [Cycloclasticus sp. symbiont of Bathymodiolus heckerae]
MPEPSCLDDQPITYLKGVGAKVAEKLQRLGISTVADMLFHLPFRYEDRSKVVAIGSLQTGQSCLFEGQVELTEVVFRGRRSMLVRLSDGTGFVTLRFFHFSNSQKQAMKQGQWLRCFGDVKAYGKSGAADIVHPEYRLITEEQRGIIDEGLLAVYPVTEGLHQTSFRKLIKQAFGLLQQGATVRDCLPSHILKDVDLPTLLESLEQLHYPQTMPLADASESPAYNRLIFEELLANHLSLSQLKKGIQEESAPSFRSNNVKKKAFLKALDFALTSAQQRVVNEISADLILQQPMQRLLQGDVGSGKTVVAACAALTAIESDHQVALMAPTELLAEQHFKNFQQWMTALGVQVDCLVGRHKGKAYEAITSDIRDGRSNMIIGTQALFQEKVSFAKLGLVIIDEQHRFGVQQRLALRDKGMENGLCPHQLVMTATPIPRTLAMLGYADLDLSIIDELPPGRTPVTTSVVAVSKKNLIIERIKQGVADGRQVYWVCTLIEESEMLQCQAAEVAAELLVESLPELSVALIHGRMKAEEKEAVMQRFKQQEIDILVATTVIEVGVDVPNASLMIIENAERLGLAQLHQLRGRVGRGERASHCVLMYKPPLSSNANERLSIMRETTDGFKIAEKDMELRGHGELLGKRQAGFMRFKIADMQRDGWMLDNVVRCADEILQKQPELVQPLVHRWLMNSVEYAHV